MCATVHCIGYTAGCTLCVEGTGLGCCRERLISTHAPTRQTGCMQTGRKVPVQPSYQSESMIAAEPP